MRIAVVADIHGNLAALEAVVADLKGQAPDLVVNLGDCASGPLQAAATIERLDALGWPTIRGNHDRYLLDRDEDEPGSWEAEPRAELKREHRAWLALLPPTLVIEDMFLCHGSPRSDETYLTEHISGGALTLRPRFEIAAMVERVEEPVVLCGHTHVPRLVQVEGGPLIVNPGSVGLQAYGDDMPTPHVVETGSPHARYAILDRTPAGPRVGFRAVPYDAREAAETAAARGRPEWSHALLTGTMPR